MTTEEILYKYENGKFWLAFEDWQVLTLIAIMDKIPDKYDDLEQLQGLFIQCRNAYKDEHFKGDKEKFDKIMKLINTAKRIDDQEVIENEPQKDTT